jgi:uncharacterized membrane protein (DUF485 family)
MPYRPPEETMRFHEVQRIRQAWVWILIAFIAALCWYFFIVQIGSGEPVGTNPAPDWVVLIIWIIFGIIFPIWFLVMRLEYIVTDTEFAFRFFPLHLRWRILPYDEITTAEAVTYHPMREFGGWGIRFGWRGGMAYNVEGDRGVRILKKNGEKILFGSQQPEELERALQSGMTRVQKKEH